MGTTASAGQGRGSYDWNKPEDRRTAYLARWGALEVIRSTWRDHWATISRFLLPRSGRFQKTERNKGGAHKYNEIYDNTAGRALKTLAAGLMSGASNPSQPWFKLQVKNQDLKEDVAVRQWLDEVEERMRVVFSQSNTYRTLHQMYGELGAFSTSVSIMLEDFENVIHHYPVAVGEYCLQQDAKGKVVALYREYEKTVGETVKEFGLENCSQSVQSLWHSRTHEAAVNILHVIEPRKDQLRNPNSKRAIDMPWVSAHLEMGSESYKFLRESGFKRFPALTPRWEVSGSDTYGSDCPGMEALGDIKQLQQEQLRKGQAIDYMVRPPLQVPTELKQRESELFPGGIAYVNPGTTLPHNQTTPSGGIRSMFDVKLDLAALLDDMRDVRERIRGSFFADLFLAITETDKRMTATEIAERHEEKLIMLGPVLGRLENELYSPLIEDTFQIMADTGILPEIPEQLAGQDLTIEFISLLAQAQRAVGSNAIDRFIAGVVEIAQTKPEVLDNVNFDEWTRTYAETLGVPVDLLVSEENVDAMRQARAEVEAAQAKMAAARETAASIKDVGSVPPESPVADALTQNAGQEILQ